MSPAALPFTPLGPWCESGLQDHPFREIFPELQSPPCLTPIPHWKKSMSQFYGQSSRWDPVLSPFPPNLIHSLMSLMEKVSTMKENQSSSVTWKTYTWVYARKIKYEDWEKSFFQPCPVSWCDSSMLCEVYVPATNYADLPPRHGQVKAGKGVGQIEEANTRAEFIGILIMLMKSSCSCTGSIMLDPDPLWKKWGVHHCLVVRQKQRKHLLWQGNPFTPFKSLNSSSLPSLNNKHTWYLCIPNY